MILPLGGFGGVGFFSPGVGPLSLNPLGPSPDGGGAFSLGAGGFAMSALPAIAGGFGTGRSSYSLFGSGGVGGTTGMFGSIGLGAPMLGAMGYAGPGPNFLNMNDLFMQLWNATFAPKQAMPAGPSQVSAPQAPQEANEAGEAGKADTKDADKAEDAKAPAPAKKARRKGRGGVRKPTAPTPKITAEFQSLLAKYNAAGGDLGKMTPRDAKRLVALAKQYPSLLPKGEKAEGGALDKLLDGAKSLWRRATTPSVDEGASRRPAPAPAPAPGPVAPAAPAAPAAQPQKFPPAAARKNYHDLKADAQWRALDAAEKKFLKDYEKDYGTD